tara:strand:+ start:648 stop:947 length:300 start_codon:yes stop_codon:yes gene_type:complete
MSRKNASYIIVPGAVRYDKRLPVGARLLFGEIRGLTAGKGYCYASNGWLASKYGVSKVTISNWISKLKACNYIAVSYNPHRRIRLVYLAGLKAGADEEE